MIPWYFIYYIPPNGSCSFLLEADSSQSLARQRVFRGRLNPLDAYNNTEFISRYRITKNIFVQLEGKVPTFLRRSAIQSSVIPPTTQLAAALMFLTTGSFKTVVASSHGISQPSVSRCICTVSDALCFHTLFFSSSVKEELSEPKSLDLFSWTKSTSVEISSAEKFLERVLIDILLIIEISCEWIGCLKTATSYISFQKPTMTY